MALWVKPSVPPNGQVLFSEDLQKIVDSLESFLNGGNLGNINMSPNPAERTKASKIAYDSNSHGSTHEPGGIDEVNEIDLGGSGDLATAHASRHADGGADPLPANSVSTAMLKSFAVGEGALLRRKQSQSHIASNLGLTFAAKAGKQYVLTNTTVFPRGNGCVRAGKVYFAAAGSSVLEFNPATAAEVLIGLGAVDEPWSLLLIGTDIYVTCLATQKLKKIDLNNQVTEVVNLNTGPGGTMDAAFGLVPNADGTVVYVLGKVSGQGTFHIIKRVSLSGTPSVTHAADIGAGGDLSLPWFVKVDSTEYVVAVDGKTNPTSSVIHRRNASDLSAVNTLNFGGSGDPAPAQSDSQTTFDGQHLMAVSPSVWSLFDVTSATMKQIADGTLPTILNMGIDFPIRISGFFDGSNSYFQVNKNNAGVVVVSSGLGRQGLNQGFVPAPPGSIDTNGFASDGESLYIALSDGATSGARIVRILV